MTIINIIGKEKRKSEIRVGPRMRRSERGVRKRATPSGYKGEQGARGLSPLRDNEELAERKSKRRQVQRVTMADENKQKVSHDEEGPSNDEQEIMREIRELARRLESGRIRNERIVYLKEYRRLLRKAVEKYPSDKSPEEETKITRRKITELIEDAQASQGGILVHGPHIIPDINDKP